MNRILAFLLVAVLAFSGALIAQTTTNTTTSDSTIDSTRTTTGPKSTTHQKRKRRHKKVTTTTTKTTTKSGTVDTLHTTPGGTPGDTTGMLQGGRQRQDTINRPGTDIYAPGTGSGAPGRGTQTPAGVGRGSDTGTSTPSTGAGGIETFRHDTTGTTGPRSTTGNTGVSGDNRATSPDTTNMGTDTTGQSSSNRRTQEPGVGQETSDRFGRDVSGSGSTAGTPAPPTSGTQRGTIDRSVDTTDMNKPGDTLAADSTYHTGQRIRGSATTDTDTIRGHDVTQGQPNNTGDTMNADGTRSYRGSETDWNAIGNGLQWRDIKIGDGDKANDGDKIQVRYTGWLQENNGRGRKFDSSIDRNKDFAFTLGAGQVIKGWDEGIVGMREGGVRELLIPSSLGYGEAGAGGGVIPPNSTLIFQVELVKVNPNR